MQHSKQNIKLKICPYSKDLEKDVKDLYSYNLNSTHLQRGMALFLHTLQVHGIIKTSVGLTIPYSIIVFLLILLRQTTLAEAIVSLLPFILTILILYICLIAHLYKRIIPDNIINSTNEYTSKVLQSDMKDIQIRYSLKEKAQFFVAVNEDDNSIIGFVGVEKLRLNEVKPLKYEFQDTSIVAELKRMSVCPKYFKMGIGSQLTEKVIEFSKEQGYKYLMLTTLSTNYASQGMYKKHGFKEADRYYESLPEKLIGIHVKMFIREL